MSWRVTAFVLFVAAALVVWSSWSRPLELLNTGQIHLDGYSQIEVLGTSGWSMSKQRGWVSVTPNRARLSNTQVEQWIRLLETVEPCLPPEAEPTHTIRFSESDSAPNIDVPVWLDVVGPVKIQLEEVWYSVSSEVAEPIRFGLAPFRSLQILPPSFSPAGVKITLGDRTSLELSKASSWSVREPLLAPADAGVVQAWLEAVELKSALAILGEVPEDEADLLAGLFPVAAELSLIGTQSTPTRSVRFGKRLPDGSRLAQVRGEDVVFVVGPEDAAFMLPSPTRFLIPTCTTLVPERIHTIAVGDQALRRNALTGRFDSVGDRLLDLLTFTHASNFALAATLSDGVVFQAFDRSGGILFSGHIQIDGAQVAVWSEGLARIVPLGDELISWIRSAVDTNDQGQSSQSTPEHEV